MSTIQSGINSTVEQGLQYQLSRFAALNWLWWQGAQLCGSGQEQPPHAA